MKEKIVAVCGGFDPIHVGHLTHMKEARKLGDRLVVMLNSDEWLVEKKGYSFIPFEQRKQIIEEFECVDKVIPYVNSSVADTLRVLKPDIFAKGGNQTRDTIPKEEVEVCEELGIEFMDNVGGDKMNSSSKIVGDILKSERSKTAKAIFDEELFQKKFTKTERESLEKKYGVDE